MLATRLSDDTLTALPADIPRPGYPRDRLDVGIVHFGLGNFARSHLARYVHDVLQAGGDPAWAVCGVGTTRADAAMRDALRAQQGLYTVTEKAGDGSRRTQVIGSVIEYLLLDDDRDALLGRLTAPGTRIVSLTITEGAYRLGPHNPAGEKVFGTIVEALRARRERGIPAFAVMSCDNVLENGEVCRAAVLAATGDPELRAWIEREVAFPNSMVDRITPRASEEDVAEVAAAIGMTDAAPVVCEPFTQWVLEDRFPGGRPDFGSAGALLVGDVRPYELMKLRLLNCGHQAIAYTGYLSGHRFAHEAVADPVIREYLRRYMLEARPTIPPVPGTDLDAYQATLLERFGNPAVRDTLARLCADTSSRIGQWLVPVIAENVAAGRDVRWSAWMVASWARYAEGVDEEGRPIEVVDPLRDELAPLAVPDPDDPVRFLRHRLFDPIRPAAPFVEEYRRALAAIREHGIRPALEAALQA